MNTTEMRFFARKKPHTCVSPATYEHTRISEPITKPKRNVIANTYASAEH